MQLSHWLDKHPKCSACRAKLYSLASLPCPSWIVPNNKAALGCWVRLFSVPITSELLWWLQVQAMMKLQLTSSCKGLCKARVFHTIHFTWVPWLPRSLTASEVAHRSRGGSLPEKLIFHYFAVVVYSCLWCNHCGPHLKCSSVAKGNLAKHCGIFQVFFHGAHFSDKISGSIFWCYVA